uniref:C-type lectin domain-containing protein n=1 Tax=Naja naja TaxID=35670 RepID=A0A8C6V3Y2_NAJNA
MFLGTLVLGKGQERTGRERKRASLDYTTPGKLNMDVENQLLDPLRNASAAEHEREPAQTLSASPPSTGVEIVAHERAFDARVTHRFLPAHCKYKKIIGIVVFHLIFGCILFFLGTLVPLNHPQDAIDCPPDWFGYKGHCYSFSKEEKNWKESQNVCISHTASLAKITEEEMAIVQMFTRDHVFWIGLKRQPGQPWKWLDGENATLEVMGNGGDCVYLNDATATSGRCTNEHHYICKKN